MDKKFMVDADRVVTVCLGLVEGEWSAWAEGLCYQVMCATVGPKGRYLLCQTPRGVAVFGPGVRAAMEHVVKRDPDHAYAFLLKLKTGQQYDIPIATDAFKKAHSEATKAGQAILDDEAMERWAESWFRPGNEYAFQPGPHTCGFGMVGPEIAKPVKVRMSKSHEAAAYLDALLAKGCESRLTFMEADDEGETWRARCEGWGGAFAVSSKLSSRGQHESKNVSPLWHLTRFKRYHSAGMGSAGCVLRNGVRDDMLRRQHAPVLTQMVPG